ncbi:MAG: NirD/YgiW/YdeI family stress tolerance protein [Chitinivibrionia bacterium]|nr:NirD/YgiW/YdeI family stress tolerance protein [Chitinivibrionia bacterium]
MKKRLFFLAFLVCFLFVANIYAEGFTGPRGEANHEGMGRVVTASQAQRLRDDTRVILRGKILRSLGNSRYVFSDDSGEITLEIDQEVWHGLSISENDNVEIYGEIDIKNQDGRGRNVRTVEVDVKSIRKLG